MSGILLSSEAAPPRLTVALPAGWADWTEDTWLGSLLATGADAVLVGRDAGADPAATQQAIARLQAVSPRPLRIVVEHSPALAAAVGAGVLLAERGVSTAEARRILGPDRLLGRVVGSPTSATAAAGADLLVVEGPASEPAALRAIVEAAWAPVLAACAGTDEAQRSRLPGLVGAGAEGIVLRFDRNTGPAAIVAAAAAARTRLPSEWFAGDPPTEQERLVAVDGLAWPLPPDTAVTDLLADLGRANAAAVSLNGIPVPRRRWDDTLIAPGDEVRVTGG